ncbi:MAG: flotillin family protein [Sandaracinaceae bacterium]
MSGVTIVLALVLLSIAFIAVVALAMLIRNVLYVCPPNEVLVFSGASKTQTPDGRVYGYRYIKGGRAIRIPLLETVDRLDLTNMIIDITVRSAYSKGGIPLTIQAVANLKVPGEEPLIHTALERFLGKNRAEIMRVARETLEGNLRGVLATLTPEQVNQDKEAFAGKLTEEAEHDLTNVGLVLDTLKIQNVTDDVGYLDSIGRMRSAEIRRRAKIAEAEAQAAAKVQKWRNTQEAELAKLEAQIQVARKDNERRIADAETKREAMIAEQRAEVQASIAQATAEIDMQMARIEQVKLQLQADVVEPAEAARQQAEQNAKAAAATIVEQGRATAEVLKRLATSYRGSGTSGRDVLLMQKLVPMLQQVSGTIGELRVDKLTVIGSGNGQANGHGGDLASTLVKTSEQIRAATGVDVPAIIQDRFGPSGRPASRTRTMPPPAPAEPRRDG